MKWLRASLVTQIIRAIAAESFEGALGCETGVPDEGVGAATVPHIG
jgi:hypothetical protein